MAVSISNQAYIFLWACFGGMAIAFVFDIFRVKRKAVKTGKILTCVEDMIYWVITALILFAVVYYSNEGEIRGYILFGVLLGVIIYLLMLSRVIMGIFLACIRVLVKLCKLLFVIVAFPIKVLYKILRVPGRLLSKVGRKAFRKARTAGKHSLRKTAQYRRVFRNIRKKI